MLWPLLLLGGFFVALAHRRSPAPVVGRQLEAHAIKSRTGEVAALVFGRPYRIAARSGPIHATDVQRLYEVLRLGTLHAQNVRIDRRRDSTLVSFCFVAPKSERVPIGRTLDLDLGEAKARLVVESVTRLDGERC